jgi:hypothetical protein
LYPERLASQQIEPGLLAHLAVGDDVDAAPPWSAIASSAARRRRDQLSSPTVAVEPVERFLQIPGTQQAPTTLPR